MSDVAISIQKLSKSYTLSKGESFLALDNIDLEIERGKVMGLIGPNGAGKSTLLKILSRITYPTKGQVNIYGRLASLLEVGTGFHPELSGRENIFLNGSILGMKKDEIKACFDEIVEFSGVEKFIDTPVKHYSSGMYVRLAFSVAAHLDSDILLIDEVLAVGDAEFQRKCLNKMNEATKLQNRTVLFVSHNMSIARSLCDNISYLDQGRIQMTGSADEVTDHYLRSLQLSSNTTPLSERKDRVGNGEGCITGLRIYNTSSGRENILISGEEAEVEVQYTSAGDSSIADLNFQLNVFNDDGNYLFTLSNQISGYLFRNVERSGSFICRINKLPLMAGNYYFKTHMFINSQRADAVDNALSFEVLEGDFYNTGNFFKRRVPGVLIEQDWQTSGSESS